MHRTSLDSLSRSTRGPLVTLAFFLAVTSVAAQAPQPPPSKPIAAGAQGKIVLIQGHVDRSVANRETWDPATMFQSLFVSDRVRTLTASRTAILFIDESQVKLNAGAVLTVQQVKTPGGPATVFGLLEGEAWFRTKNPSSGLTIRTPTAAAAIRGTEINLRIQGQDTVLTVTEGTVDFSNDSGSIIVNAGEEATATPGQPPTKRVLLTPEDAVQWVLYYPTQVVWSDLPAAALAAPSRPGFDRLRSGDPTGALAAFQAAPATDPWARIGAAMAYEQLGDAARARAAIAEPLGDAVEVERRAALAAASLAMGDAAGARTDLQAALALDASALRPLVLLSSLELTQNRGDEALAAARRAVATHAKSVSAHVALAEALQARFDLTEARRELDAALAIDPDDPRALVNRARIRFGVGDTAGARQDAERAASGKQSDASVRSLLGFIALAEGATVGARAHFDAAVAADAALGEPHLGLGLLFFRDNLRDDGLLEMLTATLLEPKVSLYQSYLGKAYYQLGRFPEGLAALDTAKRLDPRDPTPWLYSSLFHRDRYEHVTALEELRRAIALNDNRAVYRSRLLLDRDLATKNVSLAQLYADLGFASWGAAEAVDSLNADLTNASAHLFMADTYGNLPDRTQAFGSELLQYFLYSPVNLNSFNNFAEYTALLEQPLNEVLASQGGGDRRYAATRFTTRSGNQRFAHTAFVDYYRLEGTRLDDADQRVQGFGQAKVALGETSDLFLSGTAVKSTRGQDPDEVRSVGTFPHVVLLTQITDSPDRTFTRLGDLVEGTAGYKRVWRPGSALTSVFNAQHIGTTSEDPDAHTSTCLGLSLGEELYSSSRLRFPLRSFSAQAQQATRWGRHQLLVGAEWFHRRTGKECSEDVFFITGEEALTGLNLMTSGTERAVSGWVRDEIEIARPLHVTVGAQYVDGRYGDVNETDPDYTYRRWNPFAGASLRLSRATSVNLAAFRTTNSNFVGARISPPTVAGFVLERNELPTAERDEADASLQHDWSRAFVEVRGFVRRTKAPAFLRLPPGLEEFAGLTPDADFRATGIATFANVIISPGLSLFADGQFVRRRPKLFDRDDTQVSVGVNYIHRRGVFARVTTRFLNQEFGRASVTGLPPGSFTVTDASAFYEFAAKRGLLSVLVTNLFDKHFQTVIEGLSVQQPLPYRRATATLRWRL